MNSKFKDQKMRELEERIEKTRDRLNQLMKEGQPKDNDEILKLSMHLDELINEFMKMMRGNL